MKVCFRLPLQFTIYLITLKTKPVELFKSEGCNAVTTTLITLEGEANRLNYATVGAAATVSVQSPAMSTPNNVNAVPNHDPEANKPSTHKTETKKIVRLLTVIAYMMSVSMAAITLSAYYIFLWNPKEHRPGPGGPLRLTDEHPCPECFLTGMSYFRCGILLNYININD